MFFVRKLKWNLGSPFFYQNQVYISSTGLIKETPPQDSGYKFDLIKKKEPQNKDLHTEVIICTSIMTTYMWGMKLNNYTVVLGKANWLKNLKYMLCQSVRTKQENMATFKVKIDS